MFQRLPPVHKTLARLRSSGSHNSLERSGRPRVTTPQTDRMIRRENLSAIPMPRHHIFNLNFRLLSAEEQSTDVF